MVVEKKDGTARRLEEQALTVQEKAQKLEIRDTSDVDVAAEYISGLKELESKIKEHHDPIKKATHKAWKTAVAQEKEMLAPVQEAMVTLRDAMKSFKAQEAERQKQLLEGAIRQARDQAAELGVDEDMVPVYVEQERTPENVTYRSSWRWEMVDESKVPREYLTPDTAFISKRVRRLKGSAEKAIPGIRVWEEKIPVVKR